VERATIVPSAFRATALTVLPYVSAVSAFGKTSEEEAVRADRGGDDAARIRQLDLDLDGVGCSHATEGKAAVVSHLRRERDLARPGVARSANAAGRAAPLHGAGVRREVEAEAAACRRRRVGGVLVDHADLNCPRRVDRRRVGAAVEILERLLDLGRCGRERAGHRSDRAADRSDRDDGDRRGEVRLAAAGRARPAKLAS
jgi:hypothetical protein